MLVTSVYEAFNIMNENPKPEYGPIDTVKQYSQNLNE